MDTVAASSASLNVAVTAELVATSVTASAGLVELTVGAVVSGPVLVTNATSTQ